MNKDKAQKIAKQWNQLRIDLRDDSFTKTELSGYASIEKIPYYSIVPNKLIEKGLLVLADEKNRLYRFSKEPIHFSIIIDAYMENVYKKRNENKSQYCNNTEETSELNIKDAIDVVNQALFTLWKKFLKKRIKDGYMPVEYIDVLLRSKLNCAIQIITHDLEDFENIANKEVARYVIGSFEGYLNNSGVAMLFSHDDNSLYFSGLETYGESDLMNELSERGVAIELEDYSNQSLVEELRNRGVDVTAKQIVEL